MTALGLIYDVRKRINLKKPMTGRELIELVKTFSKEYSGEYQEELISSLDDVRIVKIGLASQSPNRDIVLRTGPEFANTNINPNELYPIVGVGSAAWPWPGIKHIVAYREEDYARAVDEAKKGIEKLL